MGNRLVSREGGEAGADESQRAFIDEAGNLRRPSGAPARQIEMGPPTGAAPPSSNAFQRFSVESGTEGAEAPRRCQWLRSRVGKICCPDVTKCFPNFRWCSVLGVIVWLQLIIYFASCWVITPRTALQPNGLALWKIGSSDHNAERCARLMGGWMLLELRRLIVPIFLHNGVPHICFNLFFELSSGSRSLEEYGSLAFFILFFVSGICGNLLSDAFNVNGVGASTSCYGLIGAELAKLALAWPSQGEEWRAPVRQWLMQTVGMLLFWEILNWTTIDHYGHGGGLLGGLTVAVVIAHHSSFPAPGDVIKYKAFAGVTLLGGIVFCVARIFFMGSDDWTEWNGKQVPYKNLCMSMEQWYTQ